MKYLLAHDIGTSGNKATLFSLDGKIINSITHSYDTQWYNDVWVEQNPLDWYQAVCITTKQVISSINPANISAISFSGQMMGCLCVDKEGQPLHNSIIWADMRGDKELEEIKSKISPQEFYHKTGHRISASYTLAKLMWIKNNKQEVYKNTYKVLNSKDYIVHKFTGSFCTDYSDASGTNLLDINSLNWDAYIADLFEIDLQKMPELKHSIDIVGEVSAQASKETGLIKGTPVVMGGGDGSVSALGALSIEENDVFTTIGTSAWNALSTNKPIFHDKMNTFNWVHVIPSLYVPCGTMQSAGASISWLKRELGRTDENGFYDELEHLSKHTPIGSGSVLFLPYLQGERSPRWNINARGSFVGLKMETTRAEICRSVLEGIAYNLKIILDDIKSCSNNIKINKIVLTGGVCKSKELIKIITDVFGVATRIPENLEEATSVGAAVLAGIGVGEYKEFDVIKKFIKISEEHEPNQANHVTYSNLVSIFDETYYALRSVFDRLATH